MVAASYQQHSHQFSRSETSGASFADQPETAAASAGQFAALPGASPLTPGSRRWQRLRTRIIGERQP